MVPQRGNHGDHGNQLSTNAILPEVTVEPELTFQVLKNSLSSFQRVDFKKVIQLLLTKY